MRGLIEQVPPGEILELLGNSLDAQVSYVGADLRYRFANNSYHEWLARSGQSLRGKKMLEVLGKDLFEPIRGYVEAALRGEPSEFEVFRRTTQGLRLIVGRLVPDCEPDGSVNGFLEILRDVTEGRRRLEEDKAQREERERLEKRCEDSDRRFKNFLERSPLSIQVFDSDGSCIKVNAAWKRLWQVDSLPPAGYNLLKDGQLRALGLRPSFEKAFKGEVVQTSHFEFDPKKSGMDGSPRWVRAFCYPIRTGDEPMEVVVVMLDVEGEQRYQEELEAAKERFQLIVNTALDAVLTIDDHSRITSWEGQAANIFGWTREEVLGQDLFEAMIPADQDEDRLSAFRRAIGPRHGSISNRRLEIEAIHRSGHRFPVEVSISRAKLGDEHFFSMYVHDITLRKGAERELQRLNSELEERVLERTLELQRANRELEAFSYSVAHDLRSPLRRLSAIATILEQDYGDRIDEAGRDNLEEIKDFAKDMTRLIEDHLHFAKFSRSEINLDKVDFSALAWTVARDVLERYPHPEIKIRVLPTLRVKADPQLLGVVLENLIDNAAKFTQRVSTPKIEVGTHTVGPERVFYVRDNGVGFDGEYREKLFQAFQRLHREGQYAGTGVGLANVKRIVERHGGRIWAEGEEGKGAAFYFTLAPLVEK